MMDLLPLIGGGLFGAVVKLLSMNMQNKRDERLGIIDALKAQTQARVVAHDMAKASQGFAFTRRIIALAITAVLVYISLGLADSVYVLEEVKSGGSYLFGLIDTTKVTDVWHKLEGAVALKPVTQSFQAIIGCYFGSSIAGSK